MTATTVRAQLEEERAWRSNEMRLLRNQLGLLANDEQRATYRKALVVMLYAHLEGFCHNAFAIYIQALNAAGLKVADVNWKLAASALSDVFEKLHNKDLKSKVFKQTLPEDAKLHRYARDCDFLESVDDFQQRPITLDPRELTDTESNLKPAVLRKMLFRLGFDHTLADTWDAQLGLLLGRRNNIAHGASRVGVDTKIYEEYEQTANAIMGALIEAIFRAIAQERYARIVPETPASVSEHKA